MCNYKYDNVTNMNGCNGSVAVGTTQSTSLTTTGDLAISNKTNITNVNIDASESAVFELSTIQRSYSEQEEFSTGKRQINKTFNSIDFVMCGSLLSFLPIVPISSN